MQDDTLVIANQATDLAEFKLYEISSWSIRRNFCVAGLIYGQSTFIGEDYFAIMHKDKPLVTIYAINSDVKPRDIFLPSIPNAISASPDGCYIIIAIHNTLYVWQTCTGKNIQKRDITLSDITSIKFINNLYFIVISEEPHITTWQLPSLLVSNKSYISQIYPTNPILQYDIIFDEISSSYEIIFICKNSVSCSIYDLITGISLLTFNFTSPPLFCYFQNLSCILYVLEDSSYGVAEIKNGSVKIDLSESRFPVNSISKGCKSCWNSVMGFSFKNNVKIFGINIQSTKILLKEQHSTSFEKGNVVDIFTVKAPIYQMPIRSPFLMPFSIPMLSTEEQEIMGKLFFKPKHVESDVHVPRYYSSNLRPSTYK